MALPEPASSLVQLKQITTCQSPVIRRNYGDKEKNELKRIVLRLGS